MDTPIDQILTDPNPATLAATIEFLERDIARMQGDKPFHEWVCDLTVDGHPFSYDRREYLIDVYRDNHPHKIIQKCTQVGGTVEMILRAAYGARFLDFRNILYYFPNKTHVTEFSKGRFKPLIEENPEQLGQFVRDTDSANLKQIDQAFIYFLGMRSTIETKNIPANMIVFDESDEANQDAFDKAIERLGGQMEASDVSIHNISNPTLPDYGISKEFAESDQRYWLLICPHCGADNCLEDRFMAWIEGQGRPPLVELRDGRVIRACRKCEGELDPSKGEWVPKRPKITEKRGYHYTQLWSQTFMHQPAKILEKFRKAVKEGRLTTFINLVVGFGHVDAENRLTVEEVLALCGSEGMAQGSRKPCFMGVDQKSDYLHYVIGRRLTKDFAEVIRIDKISEWDELDPLMKDFNVIRCVVDAEPEYRAARDFCEKHKEKAFRRFYNWQQKGDYVWDEKDHKVTVNRTEALDDSHGMIRNQQVVFPKRCDITKEFAEHCHAIAKRLEEEERINQKTRMKEKTGRKIYVYVPLGEDHWRHAFSDFCIAYRQARRGLFADYVDN